VQYPVIQRGQVQTGYGSGFQPGERVTGEQRSTPFSLGAQVADANGNVTFTWTIPANNELGVHRFVLTGELSGSVEVTFQVTAAPTQPPSRPGTPQRPSSGYLPKTGSDTTEMLVLIGAVLAGVGGAAVLASSRRRPSDG
jgi:LPXTG-motif cell wall-anchored protein